MKIVAQSIGKMFKDSDPPADYCFDNDDKYEWGMICSLAVKRLTGKYPDQILVSVWDECPGGLDWVWVANPHNYDYVDIWMPNEMVFQNHARLYSEAVHQLTKLCVEHNLSEVYITIMELV